MDSQTEAFGMHRAHLLNIAYRMLGEMAAAEDVVQEAWLRWQNADADAIRDPRAWLSTATVRLSLDALRRARARRETYVGPWLPEPLLPDDLRAMAADSPADHAELASDLSLALLHVLERLSPEERAALILHDAFDCEYAEIAGTLGKSEAACRKLVSRARERVKRDRPRYSISPDQHRAMLEKFAAATLEADAEKLAALFAPEVIVYTDGGGRVLAALNPIYGPDKSARFIAGLSRKFYSVNPTIPVLAELSGRPAIALTLDGALHSTLSIETDGEKITAVYVMRNPEKLQRMERARAPHPPH